MHSAERIVEVDGKDEGLFRAWHEVYATSQREGRPHASPWQLEEVRADLTTPSVRREFRAYAGLDGEEVVCAGQIGLPLLDNLRSCTVAVDTAVDARRRGHGTAMLASLIERARDHGRSTLFAEIGYGYDAPADGHGVPGPDFARAHGFTFALGNICRVLELPVPEAVLEDLSGRAGAHQAGYRVEAFAGPVPEKWVASYVALDARVATDAPMGDLEREPQAADVAAHRRSEALTESQGRSCYHAVAIDQTDQVVGYTTMATSRHDPGRGYQWGTLVDGAHRGHRLGLAVKVAAIGLLQRSDPRITTVTTWNAEVNDFMVGINEALGFAPVERLGEFQLRLAER